MRYMTKEWYETMQRTDYHYPLKVSKEAEVFSEAYFRRLHASEEKAWLEIMEKVSQVTFDEIYSEEFQVDDEERLAMSPSEFEEARKAYEEKREADRVQFENEPPFDREVEKRRFRMRYQSQKKSLKKDIPEEILQKVADIRVLALDHASADVKEEIAAYCKANDRFVEDTAKAYWKAHRKAFRGKKPDFLEAFHFHDCRVVSFRKEGKDYVLTLDNSGGFSTVTHVILRDCTVLKQDARLNGAWWLYEEVYRQDGGYEIHALLEKGDRMVDLIVQVTGVAYD